MATTPKDDTSGKPGVGKTEAEREASRTDQAFQQDQAVGGPKDQKSQAQAKAEAEQPGGVSGVKGDGRSSEANTVAASEYAKRQVTPSEPEHAHGKDAPTHTAQGDTPSTQAARDAVASSAGRKPGTTPEQEGFQYDLAENAEAAKSRGKEENVDDTRTARNRSGSKKSALADLTDMDLNDPDNGRALPLSATTESLQGTVSNVNGRAVLKIAVRGYIGEEPVTILAENAGEFEELIGELEKASKAQKADLKKRQNSK